MAKVITDIETYNLSKTGEQIDSLLDEIGSKVTQTEINTAINNLRTAIDKELTALKNGAPEAMDSLGEIANALQNNPKVIEEVRSAITKESEDRASALTAERNAWRQAVTSEQNARTEAVQQEREGREATDRDINADIENLKKADAAINDKITDLVSGGVPDESIGAEKIEGVEFTEAAKRENIATGETLKTLFGKIKKWFTDLKTVAWTGSYNDLTDTDSIATTEFVRNVVRDVYNYIGITLPITYTGEIGTSLGSHGTIGLSGGITATDAEGKDVTELLKSHINYFYSEGTSLQTSGLVYAYYGIGKTNKYDIAIFFMTDVHMPPSAESNYISQGHTVQITQGEKLNIKYTVPQA